MQRYPRRNAINERHIDRAFGALLGLAVGDALGTTLEFSERDTLPEVRDLIGGGPFDLPPGVWTDDTSMALCLADSLIENRALDARDLLDRFVRWWRHGDNSATGRCFDIGNITRDALERHRRGDRSTPPRDPYAAGNGSLMRLTPAAIFAAPDLELAQEIARRQSETTHANDLAGDACAYFAVLLVEAMAGATRERTLAPRVWPGVAEIADIAGGGWKDKDRDDIRSTGYVVHTLEAALWAVDRTDNFEDALVLAVNLAGDADTVGAVAGQLAGALYGREGIPKRWLDELAWREHIEERVSALLRAGG